MKRLLIPALIFSLSAEAQIISFDFQSAIGNELSYNSAQQAAGVYPSTIFRGSGINPSSNAGRFNSTSFTLNNVPDSADYLEFFIKVYGSNVITVTQLTMQHQRSSTGPLSFVIRCSENNFSSDICSPQQADDLATTQVSIFALSTPLEISDSVAFRIYGYNSESGSGSWGPGDGSGADLIVNGTIHNSNPPAVGLPPLRISQVYAGGGNAGAYYKNDFVELFNASDSAFSLTNYSLQYSSAAGASWASNTVPLQGSIGAWSYYLIQLSGGTNGIDLPTADLSAAINLPGTSGKLALMAATASLTGNCPSSPMLIDFLGYGSADCSEDSAPAPSPGSSSALRRKFEGCQDAHNNAEDFLLTPPSPRNSLSPPNNCSAMAPLPVRFRMVEIEKNAEGVIVHFTNETESEIEEYELQGSADGSQFSEQGRQSPRRNDGSSQNYSIKAGPQRKGFVFYRVLAREVGGTLSYSPIVVLNREDQKLFISPNPAYDQLNVGLASHFSGRCRIEIRSVDGRLVLVQDQFRRGGERITIDIKNLKPGAYFVTLLGSSLKASETILKL